MVVVLGARRSAAVSRGRSCCVNRDVVVHRHPRTVGELPLKLDRLRELGVVFWGVPRTPHGPSSGLEGHRSAGSVGDSGPEADHVE